MKKILFLLIGVMLLEATGCGATEQLVDDCKEQAEWTEENGALTNGRSSSEQIEETLEDLIDVDISLTNEESNTTLTAIGSEYEIGETSPITSMNSDGSTTYLDLTVTGYQPVYNGEKNVTVIFYTVTSKEGNEMQFENSVFTCYADSKYVEPEGWEDHTPFDFAVLIPGTSYEGCYVADVDPNLANKIDLHVGDIVWHVQKEEIPVEVNTNYNFEEGLSLSGLYSDGKDKLDISFYSVPDGYKVGSFTATMDGRTYSGELEYDETEDCYYSYTDNLENICIWFSGTIVEVYVDGDGGDVNYWSSPMLMVEHYES